MKNETILHSVPKAFYGAFGGITPFPICLKSVSDYLGDPLDYTFAIVASGGAFRLTWNTTEWDGGNVDIAHTYDDFETPYRNGITALGREFTMLWRGGNAWGHPGNGTKEDFKAFITEQIDKGKPVISLSPIGPAEAGILMRLVYSQAIATAAIRRMEESTSGSGRKGFCNDAGLGTMYCDDVSGRCDRLLD